MKHQTYISNDSPPLCTQTTRPSSFSPSLQLVLQRKPLATAEARRLELLKDLHALAVSAPLLFAFSLGFCHGENAWWPSIDGVQTVNPFYILLYQRG